MANRTVSVDLVAKIGGYVSGMQQAAVATRKFGADVRNDVGKSRTHMQNAAMGATLLGGAMVAGFGFAVAKAAEFDKAMSAVAAASMATGGELSALRDVAIEAGASTAYSATEAAQGITEMAKAGVSARDIIGGGLKGALALAAAGQLDVADAAEIAATALNVFKLSGSQMSHVADLLAAGAGKAQGSVTDMSGALNQSALVAKSTGLSIEDTTGALALFASNGLLGSDAGTSFKTMLMSLNPRSAEAAQLMDSLGLRAYDASGKFVGLSQYAGKLRTSLSGMSDEQRNATLQTIFGTDAIRSAGILYEAGSSGVNKWVNQVNDSGYAAEQAAKLTDNLAGDLERLGGAFDTALIKSGSGANDALRFLTQTATGAVDTFADLPGPLQQASVGFLGLVGSGTLALGVIGSMIPRVAEARDALRGMGSAGASLDAGLGKVGRVAGYAAAATVGVGLLSAAYDAIHPPAEIVIADAGVLTQGLIDLAAASGTAGQALSSVGLGDLADQLAMTRPDIFSMSQDMGSLGKAAAMARGDFADLSGTVDRLVDEAFQQAQQSIQDTDSALAGMVSGGHPEAAVAAFTRIMEAAAEQGITVGELSKRFPGYVAALQGYVGQSTYTINASGNVTNALGEQMEAADLLKASWDRLNGIGTDIVTAQANWTLGLASLRDGADDASYSLDINTEAGARNSQKLVAVAQDARDLAAAIGNRDGYDAGVQASNDFRAALIDQATQAGYNQSEVETLMTQIFNLDQTNSTSDLNANDNVTPAVAAARAQLASLDGTGATVTLTTINRILNARPINEVGNGGNPIGLPPVPHRAGGGRVWPGTFLVGEQGPELLTLGGGQRGMVYTASETRAMLSGRETSPVLRGREFSGASSQTVVVQAPTVQQGSSGPLISVDKMIVPDRQTPYETAEALAWMGKTRG